MHKRFLICAICALLILVQMIVMPACSENQTSPQSITAAPERCINAACYDRALNDIPSVAEAPCDDILVKGFKLRFSTDGKLENGTFTIWRYNSTVDGVDHWTQGIVTLSSDGSVTFAAEHNDIPLLSKYSPMTDRSLLPIAEVFAQIKATDISISKGSYINDTAQYYLLTYGNEEHIAYAASAVSGVDYYDEFAAAKKTDELSEENYVINGRYYFILTSYSTDDAAAENWTVFMFAK